MAQRKKIMWIEVLRIVASFGVIVAHVASQHFEDYPVDTFNWQIFNFYHAIIRFSVPCYIMISGYLYLAEGKEISISRLWKKNIFSLVVAFEFWQLFYAMYRVIVQGRLRFGSIDFWKRILIYASQIYFHLWYLPMLIGLIAITPLLKPIVTGKGGKERTEYLLILFFLFKILPVTIGYFPLPQGQYLKNFFDSLVRLELVTSYAGYYVLGHYLGHYVEYREKEKWFYGIGLISIFIGIFLSAYYSIKDGTPRQSFYENYTVFNFLYSSAAFLFFKNQVSKIEWSKKKETIICQISSCTFGIFLVHAFFRNIFARMGLDSLVINPVVSIPVLAFLIFICSYVTTSIVKKIPIIGAWIV